MLISKDVAKAKVQKMTLIKRPSRGGVFYIRPTKKKNARELKSR